MIEKDRPTLETDINAVEINDHRMPPAGELHGSARAGDHPKPPLPAGFVLGRRFDLQFRSLQPQRLSVRRVWGQILHRLPRHPVRRCHPAERPPATAQFERDELQKKVTRLRRKVVDEEIDSEEGKRIGPSSVASEGIALLELASQAGKCFKDRSVTEKRRLLNLVVSNSTWANGELTVEFRQPFDTIALGVTQCAIEKAAGVDSGDLRLKRLPDRNPLRTAIRAWCEIASNEAATLCRSSSLIWWLGVADIEFLDRG